MNRYTIKLRGKFPSVRHQASLQNATSLLFKGEPSVDIYFKDETGFSIVITKPLGQWPDEKELTYELETHKVKHKRELEDRERAERYLPTKAILPQPSAALVIVESPKKRKADQALPVQPAPEAKPEYKRPKTSKRDPLKPKKRVNSYIQFSEYPATQARLAQFVADVIKGEKKEASAAWQELTWNTMKFNNTDEYKFFKKLADNDMDRYRREMALWEIGKYKPPEEGKKKAPIQNGAHSSSAIEEQSGSLNFDFSSDDDQDPSVVYETPVPAHLLLSQSMVTQVHSLFQGKNAKPAWILDGEAFENLWKDDSYFKTTYLHMRRLWNKNDKYFNCDNLVNLFKDSFVQDEIVATSILLEKKNHMGDCAACDKTKYLMFGFQPNPAKQYDVCVSCGFGFGLIVDFLHKFNTALGHGRICYQKPTSQPLIAAVEALITASAKMVHYKVKK